MKKSPEKKNNINNKLPILITLNDITLKNIIKNEGNLKFLI